MKFLQGDKVRITGGPEQGRIGNVAAVMGSWVWVSFGWESIRVHVGQVEEAPPEKAPQPGDVVHLAGPYLGRVKGRRNFQTIVEFPGCDEEDFLMLTEGLHRAPAEFSPGRSLWRSTERRDIDATSGMTPDEFQRWQRKEMTRLRSEEKREGPSEPLPSAPIPPPKPPEDPKREERRGYLDVVLRGRGSLAEFVDAVSRENGQAPPSGPVFRAVVDAADEVQARKEHGGCLKELLESVLGVGHPQIPRIVGRARVQGMLRRPIDGFYPTDAQREEAAQKFPHYGAQAADVSGPIRGKSYAGFIVDDVHRLVQAPATSEGGRKNDSGKTRWDLVPPLMLEQLAEVLTFGAKKYGANNWRNLEDARGRYIAAAFRHMAAWRKGEERDQESGLHHLAHAMCCMAFLGEPEMEHPAREVPARHVHHYNPEEVEIFFNGVRLAGFGALEIEVADQEEE